MTFSALCSFLKSKQTNKNNPTQHSNEHKNLYSTLHTEDLNSLTIDANTKSLIHNLCIFIHSHILRAASLPPPKEVSLASTLSYDKASAKMSPSAGNVKALIQTYTRLKSHVPPGSPIPLMVLPPSWAREVNFFVAVAGSLLFPS